MVAGMRWSSANFQIVAGSVWDGFTATLPTLFMLLARAERVT
jgi:hypothetical protein